MVDEVESLYYRFSVEGIAEGIDKGEGGALVDCGVVDHSIGYGPFAGDFGEIGEADGPGLFVN